jgi:hypothetical protein
MEAARARLDGYQPTMASPSGRSSGDPTMPARLLRPEARQCAGRRALHGEVEVGWRLREDAWGQGYAKEAATASLDLAFDRFAAPRVIALRRGQSAEPRPDEAPRHADLPEHDYVDRRFPADAPPNPQVTFAITAEEWRAQRDRRAEPGDGRAVTAVDCAPAPPRCARTAARSCGTSRARCGSVRRRRHRSRPSRG